MILLTNSTTAVINLVTTATQVIAVQASWVDVSGTIITPGSQNFSISTGTTTPIVGSPGATTQRNVKFLSIRNTDTSVTETVTVQHFDGVTTVPLLSVPLQAGYTLFYEDTSGWYVVDGTGGRQGTQGIPGTAGTDGTNGTNGTNAGNIGTAIIDFGSGNYEADTVVTGQAGILATSAIDVFIMGDTTADHDANDHMYATQVINFVVDTIVVGTGFTIHAIAADATWGTLQVRFTWT